MTNDSRLREVALIIADDLIGICETATKVAHRTGNTFVIDRQRTASMIQGRIASLNKSNLNEHQPHAGRLLPCPFCGAQPQWKGAFPENRLECSQCLQATIKANWYGGDLGTVEACWNTRANAETRPSESGECQPPAVFSDPVEFNEYAIPNSERTLPATPLLQCEPVAWVVQLLYGENRWSGEMLTDVLPLNTNTYRVLRPLYASPIQGAGVSEAEIIERCAKVAEDERQHSNHAHQRGDQANYAETGFEIACDQIASAIRSLTTPPASTDGAVGSVKP